MRSTASKRKTERYRDKISRLAREKREREKAQKRRELAALTKRPKRRRGGIVARSKAARLKYVGPDRGLSVSELKRRVIAARAGRAAGVPKNKRVMRRFGRLLSSRKGLRQRPVSIRSRGGALIRGEDEALGFSFKSLFKRPKKILGKRVDWKKVTKTAMVVGPIVATVYPPAAPAIMGGLILLKASEQGDPKAAAKIAAIEYAAQSGNPKAQMALQALGAAQAVIRQQKAAKLSDAAQQGNPTALAKLDRINYEMEEGNPEAYQAAEIFNLANLYRSEEG